MHRRGAKPLDGGVRGANSAISAGGALPHTQHGFAQTSAEQHFREQPGDADMSAIANEDPTTLKFEGKVALSDDDAGSDPYNRTGRFRRVVR